MNMNQPIRNVFNLKRFYNDELTSDLRLHIVEPGTSPLSQHHHSHVSSSSPSPTTTSSPSSSVSSSAAVMLQPNILKTFFVHKLFLAARSEVFYTMFYGCAMRESVANQHQHQQQSQQQQQHQYQQQQQQQSHQGIGGYKMDIYFEHPLYVMELFLDYIYTNVCQIDGKTAIPLMSIADEFAVNDLKKLCARYVKEEVNFENCCDLLELSSLYNESDLNEQCALFIVDHATEIFKTDGFLNLSQEALIMLLQRQDLSVPEIEIFEAVNRWYKHKLSQYPHQHQATTSTTGTGTGTTTTVVSKKRSNVSQSGGGHRSMAATVMLTAGAEHDHHHHHHGHNHHNQIVKVEEEGDDDDDGDDLVQHEEDHSEVMMMMTVSNGGGGSSSSSSGHYPSYMNNSNSNSSNSSNSNNSVNIEQVLNHVRLPLIKAHDLITIVKPSGLVSADKYMQLMEYKAYPQAFQKEQSTDINYQSRESKAQFRWCNNHGSTDYVLTNGGSSVEKVKNSGWNMVMMSDKAFTSGLNSWSISVDKINSDRSGMVIGVVSDPNHPSDGYKSCSGLGMSGYAYNVSKQVSAYGAKQGDHVHVIVDFDRDVITFRLNDTVIGTSVKAPSMMKVVYACVFIYFESNKITAHFGM